MVSAIASEIVKDVRNGTRSIVRRGLWSSVLLTPSAIALAAIVLLAVLAGSITSYGEAEIDPLRSLEAPSRDHLMGTDMFGRDILTRVLHGARLSLTIGVASAAIGASLGLMIGLAAGYFGRWTDSIAMRAIDVLLAFPGTLLAMVIVAMLGPNVVNLVLAVGVASVPGYARLVRSLTLSIREADYVVAARAIGCRPIWIIRQHVFPNLRASLVVYATLNVATAILTAAGLGFLGLGSKPPTAEWGLMIADGRDTLEIAWWVTAFPGLAILVTTLVIYSFGETLNAALDPRRDQR